MAYSHTSRRLATDAKIALERAGYRVNLTTPRGAYLDIDSMSRLLPVEGGTVDNTEVVDLLAAKGFNAFGHKRLD